MQANDGSRSPEDKLTMDLARGKPKADQAFDGWLTHHLDRLYGPVIHESIPADLLKLLEERLG
jgi:hypothetical protein